MDRRKFLRGGLGGALFLAVTTPLGLWAFKHRRGAPLPRDLKVFSDPEAATLAAVADRMVAPLNARELQVVTKIDSLLAAADDLTQLDLKRLLWVLGSAFGSLFFEGRLTSFTAMGPEEQEKVLTSWRDSRLDFRRSGFQALQRLCLAVAYATPSLYPAIGYPGPPFLVRPDGATVGGLPPL